jgi:phospholipid/cholesterol/gamma-HCH transport system substrate-binding protein
MASNKQDAILGVVFFAAIGLLLAATLLLTNFSFRAKPKLEVAFVNGGGLQKGDAVFVLGRRAGEVLDVGYQPANRSYPIAVTMQLDEALALKNDARIEIIDANLLGGKRIEIDPGQDSAAMPSGTALVGTLRKSPLDALGDELQGEGGLVAELKTAVNNLNEGNSTLAQLFTKSTLHDALLALLDGLNANVNAISAGRGALGRVIHDQQMGDDLAATLASVRSVAGKLDVGEGVLGMVLNDKMVAGQVRDIVGDVAVMTRDLRDGQGTAGLLLRDPELRAKVQGVVADVADLVVRAKNPDAGLIGALFSDTQMLADARGILTSFREFADRATYGNGLLARLVNDPDWGRRFGQILGQVQRAVEDAREAAPVGTFFQVITGFF